MERISKKCQTNLICIEIVAAVCYCVANLIWISLKANQCKKSVYPISYEISLQYNLAIPDLNGNTFEIIGI